MSKKGILIVVFVLVFLVIAVVIYLMMSTNKKANSQTTEATKTQSGISNLLNSNWTQLIPLVGQLRAA
jgi:flagellar basal body-associated protein FliL